MNKNFKQIGFAMITISLLFFFSGCELFEKGDDKPIDNVGEVLWTHDIVGSDSLFTANTMALGINGEMYYVKQGGTLYWKAARVVALNAESGDILWESKPIDNIAIRDNIVVGDDGTVYVIGSYKLYAIDSSTGDFKWTWEVPKELPYPDGTGKFYTYGMIGRLALLNDGSLILGSVESGVYSRALYCINSNGTTNWYNTSAVAGSIASNIAIGYNNHVYYYSSFEGSYHLFAVNGSTGAITWKKKITSYVGEANNIIVNDDGNLICSLILNDGEDIYMYTLDASNGNVLIKSNDKANASEKILDAERNIYQRGDDGLLYRYDKINGASSVQIDDGIWVRSTIINDMDGFMLINKYGSENNLRSYASNGLLDWGTALPAVKDYSLLVSNKRILYGSTSDKIYAVQGNAKINKNGWPAVNHDCRNTNNANK